MANVKQVEDQIYEREGFSVEIRDPEGRQRPRLADYEFARAARAGFSVQDWMRKRFSVLYPDFDVTVLRPDGTPANGRLSLARLRTEYQR